MAILNPIASNWSRVEREKLNNNWTIIESYLSNLQGQINLLTGDVDVQKLVDQINDILNKGNVVIADLEAALQDATTVITNAENATTDANNAAQDALNAINNMQAFINQFGNAESYDNSKLYKVNNLVEYDGSGFICIQETQGNLPPTPPNKRNEWWQLFAQKGLDGTGAVSKVAGKSPNVDGNVPLTAQDVGAASITEFNAHLAQSKKKVYTKSVNEMKPLVSFYLDDGYQNDYDIVLPKAKQLGIPVTICLFNQSELVSTPERLNELANGYGWEFDAHTANHVSLENLTLSQQEEEMRSNKDFFKNMGHDLKGICYPFGFTNEFTMKAAREIFDYGLGSSSSINSPPIDTYDIKRVLTDSNDLATMKDMVNKIKADGEGWIVFYSHSNIFGSNVEVRDKYFEMMDYVKNSGVESVTVSKAMETYANTLDIGDFKYAEGHFKIGANAKVDSTSIPILVDVDNEAINTRPGTSYDGDKISINRFKIGEPSDIPFDNGIGTLITDRLMEHYGNVGANARQEFYGYLGTSITRYFSGGMWTDWESIGQLNTVKNKPFNNASPITDFSYGKVTQIPLYSGDAPDFPAGGIGTLEVSRVAVNDILNFQNFYPYNSDITYRRRWTASGWTPWVKYIPSTVTITSVLNFGTIQPNSSNSVDVSVSDLSVYDAITVNASYGIIDGIVINSYIVANNTVRIRAFNLTTSPIELSRSFNIGVIKE